jgi:Ca2+/Na+ antiporter
VPGKTVSAQAERSPINWAVLILLGPPIIYLTAFAHEWAYASAFGYPDELISIQIPALIGSVFGVLGAVLGVFAYFHVLYLFARRTHDPLWFRVYRMLGILLFDYFLFRIFSHHPLEWAVYAGGITLMALLFLFLQPLLQGGKGYRAKLAAHDAAMRGSSDLWDDIAGRIGRLPINLLWGVVLAISVSYWVGRADALDATKYLVTDFQGSPMIVLRMYGNEVVMTPKAHPSGRLSGKVAVTVISDSHPFVAQEEKVGPLLSDCTWGFGCH